MAEQEIFEARLRTALARRVADGPTDFDALEFARSVAAAEPRRHGRATLRAGSLVGLPIGRSPATRLAWALAAAALLIVATVAAVFVGGELLRRSNELTVVPPPAVDLTITAHPEGVAALAWSPDGTRIATVGADGLAEVWDATNGDELLRIGLGEVGSEAAVEYSPDGTRLAAADAVYEAATGEELFRLGDSFLGYSPDGTRIGAGGAWGWAAVIDANTGEELITLPLAPSWMFAMAWSPDSTRIATTWGTSVKVWDAVTGGEELTIDGLVKMTDVAWSPDGTRIAGGTDLGLAKIWDATTGHDLQMLPGQTTVIWSPDGTRFATVSARGTADIWDADSGEELSRFTVPSAVVRDVAWSPDGARIAMAASDGTVRIRAIEQQLVPSPTPGSTAAPTQDPRALRPVGESTVSDTALGTITWQAYSGEIHSVAGTPHGPVALDDDGLRWLNDDGTWERLDLPRGASPLITNGEALFTDDSGVVRRLSWDGGGWVVGEALDVPDVFRPADHPEGEPAEQNLERVATGPRGTILFGEGHIAIARDFQHFAETSRPPVGLDPVEPFVLATADGFVAIVTTHQGVWDYGAFEPIPWSTSDGTSWEPASASSPFGENAWIDGVAGWDGRFVAVGHVGSSRGPWTAWVSDDGLAWDRLTELGDLGASLRVDGEWPFVGVTASEAGWVIYGKDGSSWASPDGRTWEPLAGLPGVRGMGWSPPEIVLAGDTIVGVGWLRGVTGDVVIGTIERPGGDGG